MAERGVLLVVDGYALRAVVTSERAHIPGNHYAVAGADVLLISRGALELTVGALTDEQRDCRRTASTHDQLVRAADVEQQVLRSRVIGADQIPPLQTGVLTQHVDDRRGLHFVKNPLAVGAQVLRQFGLDLESAGDPDQRHRHDAGPEPGPLDVVQIVRRIDQHATYGRADQVLVGVGCVGGGQLGGPLGGDRTAGISEHRHLRVVRDGRRVERGADRIERVHSILGPRGEVGPLALGVGDDNRVPVGDERAEDRRFDVGDDAAEPKSTPNRIGRLVVAVERVVGGLIRDHPRRVELNGGLMTEVTLTVGLPVWLVDR